MLSPIHSFITFISLYLVELSATKLLFFSIYHNFSFCDPSSSSFAVLLYLPLSMNYSLVFCIGMLPAKATSYFPDLAKFPWYCCVPNETLRLYQQNNSNSELFFKRGFVYILFIDNLELNDRTLKRSNKNRIPCHFNHRNSSLCLLKSILAKFLYH